MMERIYPGTSLLRGLLEELLPWPSVGSVQLVLDLDPGYALTTAPLVPRPRLIATLNQCPLYVSDLLHFQPEGIIAFSNAYNLEQIGQALAEVAGGKRVYLGPPSLETGLTLRERDIVRLLALGNDNPEIARELSVTEKTISNTISIVLSKLGLKNRVQLCYYYLGILPVITGRIPD